MPVPVRDVPGYDKRVSGTIREINPSPLPKSVPDTSLDGANSQVPPSNMGLDLEISQARRSSRPSLGSGVFVASMDSPTNNTKIDPSRSAPTTKRSRGVFWNRNSFTDCSIEGLKVPCKYSFLQQIRSPFRVIISHLCPQLYEISETERARVYGSPLCVR